jgi:hypothetical protein
MFGLPVNSSTQLPLCYFSSLLALSLVQVTASGSRFFVRAFCLAKQAGCPDAGLHKQRG